MASMINSGYCFISQFEAKKQMYASSLKPVSDCWLNTLYCIYSPLFAVGHLNKVNIVQRLVTCTFDTGTDL